eukprot:9306900-Pyramimonas_sp.AAC.1
MTRGVRSGGWAAPQYTGVSLASPLRIRPRREGKENKVWLAIPDWNLAFPEKGFLIFFKPPDRRSDGHDDGR